VILEVSQNNFDQLSRLHAFFPPLSKRSASGRVVSLVWRTDRISSKTTRDGRRNPNSRRQSNDAAGIIACLESAFAPYRDTYTPEAFDDTTLTPATIQVRLASMQVYVAITKSGEIAGTIACSSLADEEEGHIRGMAVHPDW